MSRRVTPRMRKVNELLREVIAEEVASLKDPRVGFVTVTGVDTAPDLRSARVFYSVLGTAEEQEATQRALDHAAAHVQEGMARQVRLKYLPRLSFVVDKSVEHGARLDELLRRIQDQHHDA